MAGPPWDLTHQHHCVNDHIKPHSRFPAATTVLSCGPDALPPALNAAAPPGPVHHSSLGFQLPEPSSVSLAVSCATCIQVTSVLNSLPSPGMAPSPSTSMTHHPNLSTPLTCPHPAPLTTLLQAILLGSSSLLPLSLSSCTRGSSLKWISRKPLILPHPRLTAQVHLLTRSCSSSATMADSSPSPEGDYASELGFNGRHCLLGTAHAL